MLYVDEFLANEFYVKMKRRAHDKKLEWLNALDLPSRRALMMMIFYC